MGLTTNQSSTKTNLTRAYEKLLLSIVRILLYVSYASSFYIHIIILRTFRNEFLKIIDNIKRYFRNFFFPRFFFESIFVIYFNG